jgi:hypothetical protein
MSKAFIYDNLDILNATLTAGTTDGTTFTADSNGATNQDRIIDQSTSLAMTNFTDSATNGLGGDSMIRIDVGSDYAATNANVIAVHLTAADTDDLKLYVASSSTTHGTAIATITSFSAGWNVTTFSANAGRYWFIQSDTGDLDINEIIIGNKYTFDLERDLNNQIGKIHGVDEVESWGGIEYANKRHNSKTTWSWNWSNISASMKTSLEDFRDDVSNLKKFLFYDDSSYNWVRMSPDSLSFTEISYNRFSTSITLREQLS